eukprot:1617837-Pyramimonas_sp.AAC.1
MKRRWTGREQYLGRARGPRRRRSPRGPGRLGAPRAPAWAAAWPWTHPASCPRTPPEGRGGVRATSVKTAIRRLERSRSSQPRGETKGRRAATP